jgi:ribosomal protein S18 acetylase RimI-like enzyme
MRGEVMNESEFEIRLAQPSDALEITLLYHKIYKGQYPDPLMRDVNLLRAFLLDPASVWVVARSKTEIIGSVVYEVDAANKLAKTFGGAVLPEYRGAKLLEKLMGHGSEALAHRPESAVEVTYATTRTATKAPQIVTERLGYRKLGIFPNVHRTDNYETHCLVGYFADGTLEKRFTNFLIHPDVESLFQIVQKECGLPPMKTATTQQIQEAVAKESLGDPGLEILDAPKYTIHRFRALRDAGKLPFSFYPFHDPNVMVCSPDDQVQVFLHLAPLDQYCTVVGILKPEKMNGRQLIEKVSRLLSERGVRYIETIVRADKLGTVDQVIGAGFIPSAYFPAFQVQGKYRYDYIVLSKTFEILDFSGIELAGVNKMYLLQYFEKWRQRVLNSIEVNNP